MSNLDTDLIIVVGLLLALALAWLLGRKIQRPQAELTEDQILAFTRRFGADAAAERYRMPLKTVHRLRVLAHEEDRTCGTCMNFDLERGQLAIRSHNIMSAVTRALPPGVLGKDPSSAQSWMDFGACLKRPGMIFGATDWCGKPVHEKIENPGDMWA